MKAVSIDRNDETVILRASYAELAQIMGFRSFADSRPEAPLETGGT